MALRYFNVVGVDQKMRTGPVLGHKAQHQYPRILDAIFDVVEGTRDKIQIAGDKFPTRDGTAVRDYVHVSDLVEAHLAAFKSLESSTFEAFNIGTGKGLTVLSPKSRIPQPTLLPKKKLPKLSAITRAEQSVRIRWSESRTPNLE